MAVVGTVQAGTQNRLGRGWYVEVLLTPSGSYSAAETVDFGPFHPNLRQPTFVQIMGNAGYVYKYNIATKRFIVFIPTAPSGNSPNAEHSSAAYNAAVTGDTIVAQVWYMKTK